jgi:hypothetical protein
MPICVNGSGTWRKTTTLCVNQSGTWRKTTTSCINQSGTWRNVYNGVIGSCALGSSVEGGLLICKSSDVAWIIAPSTTQVSRDWYCRQDAVTQAQSVAACNDWFVPSMPSAFYTGQLANPGHTCRVYWDSYSPNLYWSNNGYFSNNARGIYFANGCWCTPSVTTLGCIRAMRCVRY